MTIPKAALTEIQLLIFDLDGTLVDSEQDVALSVNAMRGRMGLGPLPRTLIASYVGNGVIPLVRRALGEAATKEDLDRGVVHFLDHYRLHMLDNTVTYAGVREALNELQGRELAVLTNKPTRVSRELLAGLGIAHYFSFVYGGNSFEQKKPDPVGVLKLIMDTGIPARQTIMIGDSDTDVLAGRNAGVWTCAVTYGFGACTFARASPDLVVDDLRELPVLLSGRAEDDP